MKCPRKSGADLTGACSSSLAGDVRASTGSVPSPQALNLRTSVVDRSSSLRRRSIDAALAELLGPPSVPSTAKQSRQWHVIPPPQYFWHSSEVRREMAAEAAP
jgi:hypothetical protein